MLTIINKPNSAWFLLSKMKMRTYMLSKGTDARKAKCTNATNRIQILHLFWKPKRIEKAFFRVDRIKF